MANTVYGLEKLIGQPVVVALSQDAGIAGSRTPTCTLRGIEPCGLWLEHKDFVPLAKASTKAEAQTETRVIFIPFQRILHLFGHLDAPALGRAVED